MSKRSRIVKLMLTDHDMPVLARIVLDTPIAAELVAERIRRRAQKQCVDVTVEVVEPDTEEDALKAIDSLLDDMISKAEKAAGYDPNP